MTHNPQRSGIDLKIKLNKLGKLITLKKENDHKYLSVKIIHGSHSFLLSLLYVLHAHSTVPVKQNPAGQAAHLCLQVGSAQRGPQVGACCAPPLPCTNNIMTYKC